MTKKRIVTVSLILVIVICVVIFLLLVYRPINKRFISDDELTSIYNDNKELFNDIKGGLFSSDFIPHDGMTESGYKSALLNKIDLYYDYKNAQLICHDDPQGNKLQSIQNVQGDIINYFLLVKDKEKISPSISFWKLRDRCTIIQFEFDHAWSDTHAGIMYITSPKDYPFLQIHLEGNWYVYRYQMP